MTVIKDEYNSAYSLSVVLPLKPPNHPPNFLTMQINFFIAFKAAVALCLLASLAVGAPAVESNDIDPHASGVPRAKIIVPPPGVDDPSDDLDQYFRAIRVKSVKSTNTTASLLPSSAPIYPTTSILPGKKKSANDLAPRDLEERSYGIDPMHCWNYRGTFTVQDAWDNIYTISTQTWWVIQQPRTYTEYYWGDSKICVVNSHWDVEIWYYGPGVYEAMGWILDQCCDSCASLHSTGGDGYLWISSINAGLSMQLMGTYGSCQLWP